MPVQIRMPMPFKVGIFVGALCWYNAPLSALSDADHHKIAGASI